MIKVNFGCGSIQPEGWINIDYGSEFGALVDFSTVEDNSVDIIVCHAALQQTPWHELVEILETLRDKLKPGGLLRISLPDIERGFEAYREGDREWFPNSEDSIEDRFSAWLTWYSTSCTLLTPGALMNKLHEAGFGNWALQSFGHSNYSKESTELDTRQYEFYFAEVTK
jgi:SAM-dependent methyltransferase